MNRTKPGVEADHRRGLGGTSFRATPELERKLEEAAGDARSLSEEVELRLERSFSDTDLVREAVLQLSFGSRKGREDYGDARGSGQGCGRKNQ